VVSDYTEQSEPELPISVTDFSSFDSVTVALDLTVANAYACAIAFVNLRCWYERTPT